MKNSEILGIAVIAVIVVLGVLCVVLFAGNGEVPQPVPLPTVDSSGWAPSGLMTASSTMTLSSSRPVDAGVAWAVVQKLSDAEGKWGDAELSKTSLGTDPYAWHLTVGGYDCGVHELLIENYRLAYCLGGTFDAGRRHAVKLGLHYSPNGLLHIQIGDQLDTVLRRSQ